MKFYFRIIFRCHYLKYFILQRQPLKKTDNRPNNFNSNFNFGLVKQRQTMNNIPDSGQFMDNYINNMANNRLGNIQMNRGANIGEQIPTNLLARQFEHMRNIRHQNANVFHPDGNFNQQNQQNFGDFGNQARNANFRGVDMTGMRIPDSIEMFSQPYGNENYEPVLRGHGFGNQQLRERNQPYRSSNRGFDTVSNPYSHAY